MAELDPNLKKIYAFHFFNTIAISVVANFLFLDRIFLRMGLNMQQFGAVKGFAYLLPMCINLLLSPFIGQFNKDREIVAVGYLVRVFMPLLFLLLPGMISNKSTLVSAITVILITVHIFPIIANNSIQLLVRSNVPQKVLGIHLSRIALVWTLPSFLLAIPLSWILDRHSGGSDSEFYRTMFFLMFSTALFELIASSIIMKLPRSHLHKYSGLRFGDIMLPFRNMDFRNLLLAVGSFSILTSMIAAFINPYLLEIQGISMTVISIISAAVALLSILALPYWGKLVDHVGGKNIYTIAMLGITVGVLALLGKGLFFILIYALFAWQGSRGIFGSGIYSIHQFMVFSQSKEDKRPIFFAASTFVLGVGWFLGAFLGGFFLEWLRNIQKFSNPMSAYRIYFGLCGIGSLFMIRFSKKLKEDNPKLSAREMRIAMNRTFRNLFGRTR
ncbi:MAG: hypothetical protein DRP70_04440 [Spirochaetes bacterium]|nr:MAG: hypothetical protein DRP49_08750 [Spirochaetota bacterium]RKX89198.1 MAG: hypothetical protein DRP70_04440 [Spirochaetota bacterium]